MRVIFIRHGQSTGNVSIPRNDLSSIALTELGWQQARQIAADWREAPTLLITSPYLCTQQTAAPTQERFPDVPVEVWPVEEFTYLQPVRWNGTRSAERMPYLERYWHAADPAYLDGVGAESFSMLLRRVEATLNRLAALPATSLVYCIQPRAIYPGSTGGGYGAPCNWQCKAGDVAVDRGGLAE
jgi:broad specificity phosphatase PhoE